MLCTFGDHSLSMCLPFLHQHARFVGTSVAAVESPRHGIGWCFSRVVCRTSQNQRSVRADLPQEVQPVGTRWLHNCATGESRNSSGLGMPTIQVDVLMMLICGGGDQPDLEVMRGIILTILFIYRTCPCWEWTLQGAADHDVNMCPCSEHVVNRL